MNITVVMWTKLLVFFIFTKYASSRSLVIDIDSCRQEFNKDIVRNMNVSLINDGKRNMINGSVVFAIDIAQFELAIDITVPQNSGRSVTVCNVTVDGCNYIEGNGGTSMNLPSLLMGYFRRFLQNLPNKCPVKKHTEMIIAKLFIDSDHLPLYFIHSRFQFTFTMKHANVVGYKIISTGYVGQQRRRKG